MNANENRPVRNEADNQVVFGNQIVPQSGTYSFIESALELASNGWAVLPCIPSGPKAKAPLTAHGFKDATTEPIIIKNWAGQWEGALVGIAIPTHLMVLDIDPRHGGSLETLAEALGLDTMPETLSVTSGRMDGGVHLYYQRPTGNLKGNPAPGIDLRDGGKHYVIAPPSPHPLTGQPYRWVDPDVPIGSLPAFAVERLRQPAPPRQPVMARFTSDKSADGLIRTVATSVEGNRNNVLYWAANKAIENNNPALLPELGKAALAVGLPASEISTVLNSARHRNRQVVAA